MEEFRKLTDEEQQQTEIIIVESIEEIKKVTDRMADIAKEDKELLAENFVLIKEIVQDLQNHLARRKEELQRQIIFYKNALKNSSSSSV